jgi:hypothetical protein
MSLLEIIQKEVVNRDGKINPRACHPSWWENRNLQNFYAEILERTKFLDSSVRFAERIYCVRNNITTNPLCSVCHKNLVKYSPPNKSYRETCGLKCGANNPKTQEKTKATVLLRFGVEVPAQSAEVKQKIKETCLAKYGVDHPRKSQELMTAQNERHRQKYGKLSTQMHLSLDSLDLLNDKVKLTELHSKHSVQSISEKLGVSYKTVRNYLIKHEIPIKKFYTSQAEREIQTLLSSLEVEFLANDRKILNPKELDLVLRANNLAIEFDGMFWHSFNHKESKAEREMHLQKTLACRDNGLQLFHIFENEWLNPVKKDIWKSIISTKLNKNKKIFARQCEIVSLSAQETEKFLNENHLQGNYFASVNLGLSFKGETVMVLTFAKPRFNKNFDWELTRLCSRKYHTIVGGASRLFSHFVKQYNPKNIISYADFRYSTGTIYEKLGFVFLRRSEPNYFYCNFSNYTLESRIKYQKHKLSQLLEEFDPNKSESENMFAHGFSRIWDCGNLVFQWNSNSV